jgi:hypothetical protein
VREGHFRKVKRAADGTYSGELTYALLREDWQALPPA